MAKRTETNLGLTYGWKPNDGLGAGLTPSLKVLATVVQLAVESIVTVAPGTPTDDARYLVASPPFGAFVGHVGEIATYRDGGWDYLTPKAGWVCYVRDTNTFYYFDGTDWVVQGPSIEDGSVTAAKLDPALPGTTSRLRVVSGVLEWRNEAVVSLTDNPTITTDLSAGELFVVTLGGNRTLAAPTNMQPGAYTWLISQDATGSRTLAFDPVFTFNGTDTLSTTANAVDILTAVCDGTNLYCVLTPADGVSGGGGSASTASEISIVDAGGYFTATDVEGALQEIGAGGIGGGGSLWTPTTLVGSDLQTGSANNYTLTFPVGTAEGDLAIITTNHGWGVTPPSGWTVLDSQVGSSTIGATYFKILSAGDVSTGSVNVTYSGTFQGTATLVVFENGTFTGVPRLASSNRTSGTLLSYSYALGVFGMGATLVTYGGARANGAVTHDVGDVLESVAGTDASAALSVYAPSPPVYTTQKVNYAASSGGTYTAMVVVSGVEVSSGGGGGSNNATIETVTQTSHGFVVGEIVRSSGVAGQYTKSQADSAANAEVAGIVSEVTDVDTFTYTIGGIITTGVPVADAGTTFYLSPSTAGQITETEPSATGQVSKPVLTIIESGTKALVHNMRGFVISGTTGSGPDSTLTWMGI